MDMNAEPAIRELLKVAVHAPSGDNAQPWEFAIRGDDLFIFMTDADATLYNFKNRGTLLSHGALIENIVLLAREAGYACVVRLMPGEVNCTARISFTPAQKKDEPLVDAIMKRATNRKPYRKAALNDADRDALTAAVAHQQGSMCFVDDLAAVRALGSCVSLNERLLMENRELHDFLFGMIRWSRVEEAERSGLFITTMELPPPVRLLFRYVLPHWGWVRALGAIGFPRAISAQTASIYSASSAFALFIIQQGDESAFIDAGRTVERFWLTAAAQGLAVQPTAGIPYLAERIRSGAGEMFSSLHRADIQATDARIREIAAIPTQHHIAMMLRIGYADLPTAQSAKRAPVFRAA